jgi:hypothetical protein
MLETAAFFIVLSGLQAPYNELSAFKSVFNIKDQYSNFGQALFASMQHHCWSLSQQLVLLSLSNDNIEEKLKSDKLKRLLIFETPDQFQIGRPELSVILMSTEMSELVGPELATFESG